MRKSNLFRTANYLSLGLFAIISITLLCPITPNPVYAEITTSPDRAVAMTDTKVYVKSSISIAVDNSAAFEINPSSTSAIGHGSATITVGTNNRTGYSLWLRATDADLHNRDPKIEDVISSLPSNVTASLESSDFGNNKWGYRLNGDTYTAMPTTSTMVENKPSATASETHTLTIGAKIDSNLPAGEYRGTIEISAVANPITVLELGDIDTMQEMTHDICAATEEGESKSLTDTRDNKNYRITKLKDGNCWMTENLKYSLTSLKTLTPDDSDVAKDWTPKSSTRTTSNNPGDISNTSVYSWTFNNRWYYQWTAANAGAQDMNDVMSNSSICPKGWKLPTAGIINGIDTNTTNGSFYNLLNAYGLATQPTSVAGTYDVYQPDGTKITTTVASSQYSVTGQPLSFTYDGQAEASGNTVSIVSSGTYGRYLSSAATNTTTARGFMFNSSTLIVPNNFERTIAISVRCLAR